MPLILALEKILDAATLGTLIGGIIGYAIAGKREASSEKDDERQTRPPSDG